MPTETATRPHFFEIQVDGDVIAVEKLAGLAWLKYESACMVAPGRARLLRVWTMRDPALDGVDEYIDGNPVRVGGPRIANAADCQYRQSPEVEKRRCNGLNIEIGKPSDRCLMRPPHWREGMSNMAWLLSGGSILSYGICCAECPVEALQD